MNEFEELVWKMREAQKRFFTKKCGAALQDAKVLERSVDLMLQKKREQFPVEINQLNLDL